MACPGQQQRQAGTIVVNFTKRVFPTPIRESTKHLEDEVRRAMPTVTQLCDGGVVVKLCDGGIVVKLCDGGSVEAV